jgi:hypothetical protein
MLRTARCLSQWSTRDSTYSTELACLSLSVEVAVAVKLRPNSTIQLNNEDPKEEVMKKDRGRVLFIYSMVEERTRWTRFPPLIDRLLIDPFPDGFLSLLGGWDLRLSSRFPRLGHSRTRGRKRRRFDTHPDQDSMLAAVVAKRDGPMIHLDSVERCCCDSSAT